jgi:hypothetical protein
MIAGIHSEDPVLDKILTMEQVMTNMEMQNKLLLVKIDHLTTLLTHSHLALSLCEIHPTSLRNGPSPVSWRKKEANNVIKVSLLNKRCYSKYGIK